MSRKGDRCGFCAYCGAACVGVVCPAHADLAALDPTPPVGKPVEVGDK